MERSDPGMIGVGLYTVPEAARLAGVPSRRIRRWVHGYRYRARDGAETASEPLWCADAPAADTTVGLSFLDMMEVRMVNAFRGHGVSWAVIRDAARHACELFRDNHPFTMRRFQTDGNRIFGEAAEGVLDMNRRQWVSKPVVQQSLFEGIEFDDGQAARWYPARNRKVVVDPARSFGRPVLADYGVPTEVLFAAFEVEGSVDKVSRWYDVPKPAVRAAIGFERKAAA